MREVNRFNSGSDSRSRRFSDALLAKGIGAMDALSRYGVILGRAAPLTLLCLLLGCGANDGYRVVPVAGTITVADQPVANVRVQFQPMAPKTGHPGPASVGTTDASGRYRLRLIDADHDRDGAVVGRHRVRFNTVAADFNPDDPPPVRSVLPPGQESKEIEFEVPAGGTNHADFHFPME